MLKNIEYKDSFLLVFGALAARVISLKKAAEVMEVEPEFFLRSAAAKRRSHFHFIGYTISLSLPHAIAKRCCEAQIAPHIGNAITLHYST
jgi:hypothetical protein